MSQNITPIINERIVLEERICLPPVTFHAKHDRSFITLDDPKLDGAHIHDDYEIYLHMEGDGAFLVNNRLYPLHRGDVIFTRPGDVHVFIPQNACLFDHACLWLSSSCDLHWFSFSHEDNFCPHLTFAEPMGERLIELLCRLADDGRLDATEKLSALLQSILIVSRNGETAMPQPSLPEDVQRIIDYIDAEFPTIPSIEEVATRFHISSATLGRRFRHYIRLSPGEFINAKRLAYAKKLLDNGANVTESCMRSGFSSCSYFISVFKKKFGKTPYEYKRRGNNSKQNH